MKTNILTLLIFCLFHQNSFAQDISLIGTLWIDDNTNNQFDGESGFDNVKVYLINAESMIAIDSSFTSNFEFNFPSTDSLIIPPGSYYLEIDEEEFNIGGTLLNISSCSGYNDANDGIDNDDNGQDMIPISTTNFPLDSGLVEHVDICVYIPCNQENFLAFESCEDITDADVICDINTLASFCSTMPSVISSGNQPTPLCFDDGIAENISWFAFQAFDGNYTITVTPFACENPNGDPEGIQIGIYTDCTFTESVICDTSCSTYPTIIESNMLNSGQTYYLFINGCNSTVCPYTMDIDGIPIPPFLGASEVCILDEGTVMCEDMELLPDSIISFQAQVENFATGYTWSITAISDGPYTGNSNPQTTSNTIDLTFGNKGVYSVCLNSMINSCNFWSGNICREVTITNTVSTTEYSTQNINITPSPVIDYINIDIETPLSNALFTIYTYQGAPVISGKLDRSSKINVSNLASGLYVIGIVDSDGTGKFVSKFVKG